MSQATPRGPAAWLSIEANQKRSSSETDPRIALLRDRLRVYGPPFGRPSAAGPFPTMAIPSRASRPTC